MSMFSADRHKSRRHTAATKAHVARSETRAEQRLRGFRVLIWLVGGALILASGWWLGLQLERGRAKRTEAHMLNLSTLLRMEQIEDVSAESIGAVLARHGSTSGVDGWGRPLVVELVDPSDAEEGFSYRIISLGRDGERGACCKRWVTDFSEDAVLLDRQWIQGWSS